MTPPDCADDFKNYFNYFTEVEEHFRSARGTGLFFLSTLDWALLESWKNAGIPLEAVLRGIDAAFEKWRSKKSRTQRVNSVAYCAQAISEEAKIMSGAATARRPPPEAPFSDDELKAYLCKNATDLRTAGLDEIAATLDRLASEPQPDLEALEQRLTGLEDKLVAMLRAQQTEQELFEARRELDLSLKPYRSKMTAEQLTMLEKHYLDRRLLERARLPRLSLFYLR